MVSWLVFSGPFTVRTANIVASVGGYFPQHGASYKAGAASTSLQTRAFLCVFSSRLEGETRFQNSLCAFISEKFYGGVELHKS